jgi:hypothetical protein
MFDILILSNGPGELTTWVRPVVTALKQQLAAPVRISVVLSPCPNAGGREAEIALAYPEVDRVQGAEHFWSFLLTGRTVDSWDWLPQGVVIFLGGDQIFPVIVGRRLGYKTLVYAEWEARWGQWIDRFAVMNEQAAATIPAQYQPKATVVGDLMQEAGQHRRTPLPAEVTIGILPGSKAQKLQMGVPFFLAIAEAMHRARPDLKFTIPVAPSITTDYLARFANPAHNGATIEAVGGTTATLHPAQDHQPAYLLTGQGLPVSLHTEFPAYDVLAQCTFCLTTIGANTAELAALGIPMIVLIPTYQLDAMRSWDGIGGILARLPGVGRAISKAINWYMMHYFPRRKYAWPNIWAGREIVPERLGRITVADISQEVLGYLSHPEQLEQMRAELAAVRGPSGAARAIADLVPPLLTGNNPAAPSPTIPPNPPTS